MLDQISPEVLAQNSHLAGLAISRACDGRLRFSVADRDVWAAVAV